MFGGCALRPFFRPLTGEADAEPACVPGWLSQFAWGLEGTGQRERNRRTTCASLAARPINLKKYRHGLPCTDRPPV
jgi:hypothetical protein